VTGLRQFQARLRVYDIGDQDDLFDWMWSEFPGMFYVLAQAPPGQDTRLGVYRYGCPRTLAERRYT